MDALGRKWMMTARRFSPAREATQVQLEPVSLSLSLHSLPLLLFLSALSVLHHLPQFPLSFRQKKFQSPQGEKAKYYRERMKIDNSKDNGEWRLGEGRKWRKPSNGVQVQRQGDDSDDCDAEQHQSGAAKSSAPPCRSRFRATWNTQRQPRRPKRAS